MYNFGKESELIEFKKSTSEINEAIVSIVAMLNKSGNGAIYFGVKNNGDGIGQQISDNTLRDISRKIYEDIKPTIYPSIYEVENSPGVIVVEFKGYDRPYSAKGKFYIRSFDEDKQMDINTLLNEINHIDRTNTVWEKMASKETLSDIDEDLLKEYIKKANNCGRIVEKYTNSKEELIKLGLMSGDYLNNAGRILFSKNKPLTLKLAVFATDERLSFIDINRFEGNLFELAKTGQQYIREHINYHAKIIGEKRVEEPEVPLEAIREIVLNSLCHSSFDVSIDHEIYITPSKIVVFNPGAFPSGYVPDDFAYNGVESVLRNPLIAKVLYYSNDIDSWATGFRRIYKCCKEANVKTGYSMRNQGFEFILYRNNNISKNDLHQFIISIISDNSKVTINDISKITGKSKRTIQTSISYLKQTNRIKRIGSNKSGYWQVIE